MLKKPLRVLVVDDSPLIREMLVDALSAQPDLAVVGTAGDGIEALRLLEELKPGVLTLDLQMPRMDGLETLDRLLACRPTPVIVVSALTRRAADVTLQALDRGAMDYVAKPEGRSEMQRVFGEELPQKLRNMAGIDVRRVLQLRKSRQEREPARRNDAPGATAAAAERFTGCIVLGVSTGGPPALSTLFAALAPPLPPIVVVQHMPPMFTGPFANRLNGLTGLQVKEAQTGDVLTPNVVLVAPGGKHLVLRRTAGRVEAAVQDGDPVSGHKPSVDVMMRSAAPLFGKQCLGVIMTGMGRDGSDGCRAVRSAGGFVLGQDETSSDVYGMNKVAFTEGNVDLQVSLVALADAISQHARRRCKAAPDRAASPERAAAPHPVASLSDRRS